MMMNHTDPHESAEDVVAVPSGNYADYSATVDTPLKSIVGPHRRTCPHALTGTVRVGECLDRK
jgi:hypothetical protein